MKQAQFLEVLDRDEAERRWRVAIDAAPLAAERVPLAEALGRVLAEDVIAEVDVPGFDRSNMDGFALRAQDSFGRLVAGGLTLTFFVYIVVTMGMVSGLLPVVGVPLPLISQGGTALISLLGGFGILMAIATERRRMLS